MWWFSLCSLCNFLPRRAELFILTHAWMKDFEKMTPAVCGIASPTQQYDLVMLHGEHTGTSYRTQIGFHPCFQCQSRAYSKRQWDRVSMDQGCWVFLPHGQWPRPLAHCFVDARQGKGRIIFRAHLMTWFSSSQPLSSFLLLLCTPLSSFFHSSFDACFWHSQDGRTDSADGWSHLFIPRVSTK